MVIHTQYNFAKNEKLHVPALDIEEILDCQGWQNRGLSYEQITYLVEGEKFLKLALRGKMLVHNAMEDNVFSGDSIAIKAWEIAEEDIQKIKDDSEETSEGAILESIKRVIRELVETKKYDETKLSKKDLDFSRNFFLFLSKLPSNQNDLGLY